MGELMKCFKCGQTIQPDENFVQGPGSRRWQYEHEHDCRPDLCDILLGIGMSEIRHTRGEAPHLFDRINQLISQGMPPEMISLTVVRKSDEQ